jgi:hypothetical protein
MAALLIEAAVIISSFRNRNAASGYQLREPPGTDTILSRIDSAVCEPTKLQAQPLKPKRKRQNKSDPGYQVQSAIPRFTA